MKLNPVWNPNTSSKEVYTNALYRMYTNFCYPRKVINVPAYIDNQTKNKFLKNLGAK